MNELSPKDGEPKNFTQVISLLVGFSLFILGLSGILFSGFGGLHLSILYSTIIAISGATLFYGGYKNRARDAYLCCLFFGIFFGAHALAGWIFGSPGTPTIGFTRPDPKLIVIIPRIHELGRLDHILNTVIAFVLFGGAIDWKRRRSMGKNSQKKVQVNYSSPQKAA